MRDRASVNNVAIQTVKIVYPCLLDVGCFSHTLDHVPSSPKLVYILNDPPKSRKLQMELAGTVDFGEPFVKATYRLEGNGSLAFSAYEEIVKLQATISTQHFPNTVLQLLPV